MCDLELTIRQADTFLSRLRGLLFRAALRPGEALLLKPCAAVHTAFMTYPIDVAFLDRRGTIRKIVPGLTPWRAATCVDAWQTLELAAGEAERLGLSLGGSLQATLRNSS
jgi:uncharacterized membrane protein (UPF0127 family)